VLCNGLVAVLGALVVQKLPKKDWSRHTWGYGSLATLPNSFRTSTRVMEIEYFFCSKIEKEQRIRLKRSILAQNPQVIIITKERNTPQIAMRMCQHDDDRYCNYLGEGSIRFVVLYPTVSVFHPKWAGEEVLLNRLGKGTGGTVCGIRKCCSVFIQRERILQRWYPWVKNMKEGK